MLCQGDQTVPAVCPNPLLWIGQILLYFSQEIDILFLGPEERLEISSSLFLLGIGVPELLNESIGMLEPALRCDYHLPVLLCNLGHLFTLSLSRASST